MTKIQELAEKAKKIIYTIGRNFTNERYVSACSIIDELAGIAEAPLIVNTIYDVPPDSGDNEGYSDNYLIDLDGHRENFAIGHYDHANNRWIIHDDDKRSMFDPQYMTWQRLPLAKYDNEK